MDFRRMIADRMQELGPVDGATMIRGKVGADLPYDIAVEIELIARIRP